MTDNARIILGVITGTHGVHGRVKLKSYTDDPLAIADYAPLTDTTGEQCFSLRITGQSKGLLIGEIEGITQRGQAEALRGTELCVERSALGDVEEDEDHFYIADLIGRTVILTDGSIYGQVIAVHNYGAGDIIELKAETGKEEMVLFTKANFPFVTEDALTFDPPEVLNAAPDQAKDQPS